jgi:uncharacterized phage protein (TIGR01671 family)
MREIIFRGKSADNGEWLFGVPIFDWYSGGKTANIINVGLIECCDENMVIPETIGQYTGLKDKNGRKIFEGDICEYRTPEYMDGGHLVKSKWERGKVDISTAGVRFGGYQYSTPFGGVVTMYEVIGNIHDQKEDV